MATGADTFLWSNGAGGNSIEVSPESDTIYTVTGTSLGCSTTAEALVTVDELPAVDLGPDIILPTEQDTFLHAGGNDLSYLWSTGEETGSILVNAAGMYVVTVPNPAGCTATDTVWVTIITSVTDPNETYTVTASPNPTHDFVDIVCTGASIAAVQLIDAPGKMYKTESVSVQDGSPYRIPFSGLPSGMYFVRITTANGYTKLVPVVKN